MSVFPSKVNYATGDILTATDMNEIGQAINLLDGAQFAAGKNKIINGDFGVWQRGTSFTANGVYSADRWYQVWDGSGATKTITQQTFTPGTAPVAGYEGQYFLRFAQSVAGTAGTYNSLTQRIEDVRTFAGQTITISFWAKASASVSMATAPQLIQNFGSGGSATVYPGFTGTAPALTTSWQRFTYTTTVPSISGKTIGTSSYLETGFLLPINSTFTIDIWGVQLEAASTASPFQTATGTKQGELAACQRYYFRTNNVLTGAVVSPTGIAQATTQLRVAYPLKQTMRVSPTAIEYSSLQVVDGASGYAVTNVTFANNGSCDFNDLIFTTSGMTLYRPGFVNTTASTGYLGFTAEL